MKPDKPTQPDARHGEGEGVSVHLDCEQLREFIAGGPLGSVAHESGAYVGRQREAAPMARNAVRGSQTQISIDELVAKNRSIVERVRPMVRRAVGRLRVRFRRK